LISFASFDFPTEYSNTSSVTQQTSASHVNG
jgi:hypothetical protein